MAPPQDRTLSNMVQTTKTNSRLVDRDEFCQLLLGFRRMVRADDPSSGLRGLRDLQTGVTYLIEREKLSPPRPLGLARS